MAGVLLRALLIVLIASLALAAFVASRRPRADRDWIAEFEHAAHFQEVAPYQYTLENLRAFEYSTDGVKTQAWEKRTLNAEKIIDAWFFVEPFAASDLFAHTFVSFVFEDDAGGRETISVTIEARKERGERYSPIRGVLREYELAYVWATEKDVATRIAVRLGHPLYAYHLNERPEEAKVIFEHFALRTNALVDQPRFYNTVFSNCTNELFKAVNEAYPGSLRENAAWLMTGRAAQSLHAGGYIGDPDAPFEDIAANAGVGDYVRAYAHLPAAAFSAAWRQARYDAHTDKSGAARFSVLDAAL